jgi:hypothetical protein
MASVCIKEDAGVVVLISQDKWDRMKTICKFWLDQLNQGKRELDFKQLRSDRGFMVYVTQAYPGLKPYLKGFHLSLEMWRGGRDCKGWRIQGGNGCESNTEEASPIGANDIEDVKVQFLTYNDWSEGLTQDGPSTGLTPAAPRLKQDLEAILQLVDGDQPQV